MGWGGINSWEMRQYFQMSCEIVTEERPREMYEVCEVYEDWSVTGLAH